MKLELDWSAWDSYGQGDAYAAVPRHGEGFGKAAALCIGSRQCQKARGEPGDQGVMCPSFRIRQDDRHSTRGSAAALRAVLDRDAAEVSLDDPGIDAAMDLCVACKGCKRECPNGVDMAALRAEVLAQRWRGRRPPLRTRLLAAAPRWLPRLRPWRGLLAWRNRSPWLAAWMERATGIAAARSLPLPAATPFDEARVAARVRAACPRASTAPGDATADGPPPVAGDDALVLPPTDGQPPLREVALLVDCFARHLEPGIAEDALRVLRAARVQVHLVRAADGPALCCGRAAWSAGLIGEARDHVRRLLQALAPHLAAGRPVIGLEPSCLIMLRDEALQMGLAAEPVQALARQALLVEEFLVRLIDGRTLRPPWLPLPATVHVHGHCHQKAHGTLKHVRKLLGQVPQLQVAWIESSCCGMAGGFGYEAEHHADSMAMGELALLPAVRAAAPDALLLASGTSCRHQIADGTGRRAEHLVQLLARALPDAPTAPAAVPCGRGLPSVPIDPAPGVT
jgi:Fe-S oxidoreductase